MTPEIINYHLAIDGIEYYSKQVILLHKKNQ